MHLQKLHEKYGSKGLVVLGFNCADDARIAKDLLAENGVTYRTILDSTKAAREAAERYRMTGVPLTYILDREGRVVESFYGYAEGDTRGSAALEKLGIE